MKKMQAMFRMLSIAVSLVDPGLPQTTIHLSHGTDLLMLHCLASSIPSSVKFLPLLPP